MSPKVYRIVTIIFTVLAAGMAIMSGVFKFTQSPQVMETLAKVGVDKQVLLLGAMEVGFALLFIYPKTMKLALFYYCAISLELSPPNCRTACR